MKAGHASVFGKILEQLVRSAPRARAAILADWEGESVDHASSVLGNTSIRLMGAHWGVIEQLARRMCERLTIGAPTSIALRFSRELVVIRHVVEGYFVVLSTAPDAPLGRTLHTLDAATKAIAAEM